MPVLHTVFIIHIQNCLWLYGMSCVTLATHVWAKQFSFPYLVPSQAIISFTCPMPKHIISAWIINGAVSVGCDDNLRINQENMQNASILLQSVQLWCNFYAVLITDTVSSGRRVLQKDHSVVVMDIGWGKKCSNFHFFIKYSKNSVRRYLPSFIF